MAGPSIGTWVKVKSKSGRTTARVIANKFGGGSYSPGQVITQSEYEGYKAKRSEGMKAEGGDRRQARQQRIAEIRDGVNKQARTKFNQLFDQERPRFASSNVSAAREKAYARLDQTKAGKRADALAAKEGRQRRANQAAMSSGSGNRANRRLAEARGETVPRYRSSEQARQGYQKQQKVAGRKLTKAALSKQEKTQILLKNKKRIKAEAGKNLTDQGNKDRIARMNRLEKADRDRRRVKDRNAPAFKRAQKAANSRDFNQQMREMERATKKR